MSVNKLLPAFQVRFSGLFDDRERKKNAMFATLAQARNNFSPLNDFFAPTRLTTRHIFLNSNVNSSSLAPSSLYHSKAAKV